MAHLNDTSSLEKTTLRGSMVATMVLLAGQLPFQTLADDSNIVLKSKCASDHCIEMMLNWGSNRPDYTTDDKAEDGYTTFTFSVRGILNGNDISAHQVSYRGYTNGLECSDFGQGVVAVLGFNEGKPIIETPKGPLEITDNSLNLGCSNCAQIVNGDNGQILKENNSPSWDLALAGIEHDSVANTFSYDFENRVFFRNRGGACLLLTNTGMIEEHSSSLCEPLDEIDMSDKRFTWLKDKNHRRLFKNRDLENLLLIHSGSCT